MPWAGSWAAPSNSQICYPGGKISQRRNDVEKEGTNCICGMIIDVKEISAVEGTFLPVGGFFDQVKIGQDV